MQALSRCLVEQFRCDLLPESTALLALRCSDRLLKLIHVLRSTSYVCLQRKYMPRERVSL